MVLAARVVSAAKSHKLVWDHVHCDVLCWLTGGLCQLLGERQERNPSGTVVQGTLVFKMNRGMVAEGLQLKTGRGGKVQCNPSQGPELFGE